MKYLVSTTLLLLVAAVSPTLAQTARIAHFSHSGSVSTLGSNAKADNFGIPYPHFVEDSLRLTSDTTALAYGQWRVYANSDDKKYKEKTRVVGFGRGYSKKDRRELVRYYQQYHPNVKLIGFDSTAAPATVPPMPVKLKSKNKRRKAAGNVMIPAVPPHSTDVWWGTALLLGLAGAGWLLGERRLVEAPAA